MCGCFDQLLSNAKEKLLQGVKGEFVVGSAKVQWANEQYIIRERLTTAVVLPINTEIRRVRTNGEPYKNLTKETYNVLMDYCPFCGEKKEEEKDSE